MENTNPIITEISALANAGTTLDTVDSLKENKDLVLRALEEFDTWGDAVRAADKPFRFQFKTQAFRMRKARLRIAVVLVDWAKEHGPVDNELVRTTAAELAQVIQSEFGCANHLATRLGIPTLRDVAGIELEIVEEEIDDEEEETEEVEEVTETPSASPAEADEDPETVACLVCGKRFKRLARHLGTHSLSVEEYKKKYNTDKVMAPNQMS